MCIGSALKTTISEREQIAKPMEIYNNPKSLFVAKFVGSPQMNIINTDKEKNLALCLSQKLKIEIDKVKNFGVRPEAIKLIQKNCQLSSFNPLKDNVSYGNILENGLS